MKAFLYFLVGIMFTLAVLFASYAYAAPSQTYSNTIWPTSTNTYDLGSSALKWAHGFFTNASTTNLTIGTLNGILFGTSGNVSTATINSPLTFTGGALGIQAGSGSQNGYISSTDWNTFNNKQNALIFSYPLVNSANTISLAFGTSSSNTWGGTQTFTNTPVLGSLTGFVKAAAGVLTTALVNLASDVTGILPIANGGLATSTAPTYGQVPVGNGSGGYNLIATSSLGISGGTGGSNTGTTTWKSTVQGWVYPGDASCSADDEYKDGRQIHTLKPQYYTMNTSGVLVLDTVAVGGCNGYSVANAQDVASSSAEQFFTVSGNTTGFHALMNSSSLQTTFIATTTALATSTGFTGVELDIEGYGTWTAADTVLYYTFLTNLANTLHANGKKLMVDVPPIWNSAANTDSGTGDYWDSANSSGYYKLTYDELRNTPVDYFVVLAYDSQFDYGAGYAIQPLRWAGDIIAFAKKKFQDPNRIVIGIPSYGYQGTTGGFSITENSLNVTKTKTGYATAVRDGASGEMTWTNAGVSYDYVDSTGLAIKRSYIESQGISRVSVWSLGDGNPWFPSPSSGGKIELGNLPSPVLPTWNFSTTSLSSLFYSGGNVGIGTTSPYALLSVSGTTTLAAMTNPYVQIGSTPPTYGYLINDRLNVTGTLNDYSAANVYNLSSGTCATADWTAANDLNSTALNYADFGHTSSGFTGVGCTNNPFTGFHANSTHLIDPSGYINLAIGTTTTAFNWFTGGYAATNIKMTLTGAGNLGVGTTSPFTRLGVAGTITADNINATSTSATSLFSGTVQVLTQLVTAISSALSLTIDGAFGIDTTSNQFQFRSNGATRVLGDGNFYPSFTYSTTTSWTGTTTVPLGPAYVGETWNGVKCFTNTGTVNVSFNDGTNRMNLFNASTTVGTVVLSTNNTIFSAGTKRYVDIGTPASSPVSVSCTVSKSITAN
jgi:hypothetical protein